MARTALRVLAASLLLFAGCAPVVQTKPIAGGETVVVEAPTRRVGDEWRYTRGVFAQVIGTEGDLYITASNQSRQCRNCRYFHDKHGTVVKVLNAEGKPDEYSDLRLRMLDFPLKVGKQWTQDIDLRSTTTGAKWPYTNTFKVAAYEEITVKAGTFKAFRISWHQVNRGPYSWSGNADLWWSPDVKAFVKGVAYVRDWFRAWELEGYTLK